MHTTLTINKRGVDRIRGGHLWVYKSDVRGAEDIEAGSVVRVVDERKQFVATALFSSLSEITLRILTLKDEPIDRNWWKTRLQQAIARRSNLAKHTSAYRLVYSEGDLLPSLIVDKYGDLLVIQTLSQGTERVKDLLVELLIEELSPHAVIERNDARVREIEGLELKNSLLYGEIREEIKIIQDGISFIISPLVGQKTGSFLDQRENHLTVREYAYGRALDCFTFNGGFAINLATVCTRVTGLDISKDALVAARRNAELNNIENVEFREANVFDALRDLEKKEERFDTIVLDPPAFVKNRASLKAAARGYKEINLRALKLLNKGGILVTCTCSYHMSEEMFLELIMKSAQDAHRKVQLLEKRGQSHDHPVLLGVPETYYLKCMILRVVD
jgi:23S rRNA (cytosine1962-C5)-methyltransferase